MAKKLFLAPKLIKAEGAEGKYNLKIVIKTKMSDILADYKK